MSKVPFDVGASFVKVGAEAVDRERGLMAAGFDDESCGQRGQVETVMHMLKARQGNALTARTYHGRRREMGLMVLTHNLMVV